MKTVQRRYLVGAILIALLITTLMLIPNIFSKSVDSSTTHQGFSNKAVVVLGSSSLTEKIERQLHVSTSTVTVTEVVSQIPTYLDYDGMILVDGIWIEKQSNETINQIADAIGSAITNGTPVVIIIGHNMILSKVAENLEISYGDSFTLGESEIISYGLFVNPSTNITYPFQVGFEEDRDVDYIIAESTAQSYYWCEEKINMMHK